MKPPTRKMVISIAVTVPLLLSCSNQDSTEGPRQGSSVIPAADPEMAAAISKARDSLAQFWQVFEHPEHGETNFALKVMLTDTNGMEYLWFGQIERKQEKVLGTLGTGPSTVRCVGAGDRITLHESDIGDWEFERDGKRVGNFTIRALFKYMPKKDVESFKKVLADP